jgi:hypothetical protein
VRNDVGGYFSSFAKLISSNNCISYLMEASLIPSADIPKYLMRYDVDFLPNQYTHEGLQGNVFLLNQIQHR